MTSPTGEPQLGPDLLERLPPAVQKPAYDRKALGIGMAHVGVGAFHRCHQAEYTDDLLAHRFDRWGVVGINVRPPLLADGLGPQGGLYTRLLRENGRAEARVIGSIVSTIDSQAGPAPALGMLSSSAVDAITLTVTEKGYCHRPADGQLDTANPEINHDLANPDVPRSLPGLVVRALELRMSSHGRPVTIISCDNIPGNGVILGNVVRSLAERRGPQLSRWIEANAAFPSTMVDRIAPATTPADIEWVEQTYGYRDTAVAVGEPFRQWVIENRFAGRAPRWDLVGALLVDDVTAYEHLKMRILNAAQSTLSYLGVLVGYEHTSDAIADPDLAAFVRRMLVEESVTTLEPVPGVDPQRYIEQSLGRLRNTAIRHRNHQIATDGSQKIVQRILNPVRERLRRGQSAILLSVPVAAWMAYLVLASVRFGQKWTVDDPYAERIAGIADRTGRDVPQLVAGILAIDSIFERELAANAAFASAVGEGLEACLSDEPQAYLRRVNEISAMAG